MSISCLRSAAYFFDSIGSSGTAANSGSASHLSLSKNYTFAVLIPEQAQDGRYWELPVRGIQKAAEELKPYKVRIRYFHYDKYSEPSFFKAVD